MKVTDRIKKLARRQLALENNYQPEDTVEEITFEEGIVRGRLEPLEPERLAHELDLDLSTEQAWTTLERMTQWCGNE